MRQNKILHTLFIGFLVLALCAPGMAKKKKETVIGSQWAQNPVSVDGVFSEWDKNTFSSQKKVVVNYAFKNDAKNLYILFIFKNPKFLSTIGLTGMNIFFAPEGKKAGDHGIKFTARQVTADGYIALMEKELGPMADTKKEQIRANAAYILYGHEMISKGESGGLKLLGPVFRNKREQRTVVFEFAIPFEKLAELSPEIGAEPGKGLEVGFEWGGMTKAIKKDLAGRIGDQATSGSGGASAAGNLTSERRVSSGMGSLENSASQLERMRRMQPKKYSFNVSIKLAQSK
jgi:hypothetical protein